MRISILSILCSVLLLSSCSGENTSKEKESPEVEKQQQKKETEPLSDDNSENDQDKETADAEMTQEDQIIDKVYNLPEVKELESSVRKKSGGKRSLSLRVSSEPSDDQEYFGITVAEDNGAALATYYEFHVYPDFDIRFYDVVEDQELSLEEWRKTR